MHFIGHYLSCAKEAANEHLEVYEELPQEEKESVQFRTFAATIGAGLLGSFFSWKMAPIIGPIAGLATFAYLTRGQEEPSTPSSAWTESVIAALNESLETTKQPDQKNDFEQHVNAMERNADLKEGISAEATTSNAEVEIHALQNEVKQLKEQLVDQKKVSQVSRQKWKHKKQGLKEKLAKKQIENGHLKFKVSTLPKQKENVSSEQSPKIERITHTYHSEWLQVKEELENTKQAYACLEQDYDKMKEKHHNAQLEIHNKEKHIQNQGKEISDLQSANYELYCMLDKGRRKIIELTELEEELNEAKEKLEQQASEMKQLNQKLKEYESYMWNPHTFPRKEKGGSLRKSLSISAE